MKQKASIVSIAFGVFALPLFVGAQNPSGTLTGFVTVVGNIVNMLVPIVTTLAIVFFFYGLAKYVLNAGDEDKKEEGKNIMIWGVLAMFVLVTLWGIIAFIQKTVGNNDNVQNINIILPSITGTNFTPGAPLL